MPTKRSPRKGSMQYWPRKHARRMYPRIKRYVKSDSEKLAGFAGYKAGMTHVIITDNRPNSITPSESILFPVTVLECPPMKVASIRFYKSTSDGLKAAGEILVSSDKPDKNLSRKITLPKKIKDSKAPEAFDEIRVNVYTQPHLTGIGRKKPELFELAVGGKDAEAKLAYAKSILGKEIPLKDVFGEGQQVDVFAVTTGKGTQGPTKRFGVGLRSHKSEKGRRGPANVGPWAGNRSWRVAHAGRMGFHNRLEKNKWLLKIGEKPEEINVKGGFIGYGVIKSSYLLVKGSIPGPSKRLIRMVSAARADRKVPTQAPAIELVSLRSQG